jgi:hypothetical protein
MDRLRIAPFLMTLAALAGATPALPQGLPETAAALVAVSVELDGRAAALYPAPDGSGRYYIEARKGCRYSVALANRTGERVGVVLTVDGLNAISGERETGRGRMYVLDPWQRTSVQGWRTSLQEVRQFTFVDERASYAARSAKANEKMGWIEIAAYRERRAFVRSAPRQELPARPAPVESDGDAAGRSAAPANEAARDSAEGTAPKRQADAQARAYPGTGWGDRAHDPVVLVSFDPESEPSERVTLRYEYRSALVALGVLPRRVPPRDRLWERERAEPGFSQPPLW